MAFHTFVLLYYYRLLLTIRGTWLLIILPSNSVLAHDNRKLHCGKRISKQMLYVWLVGDTRRRLVISFSFEQDYLRVSYRLVEWNVFLIITLMAGQQCFSCNQGTFPFCVDKVRINSTNKVSKQTNTHVIQIHTTYQTITQYTKFRFGCCFFSRQLIDSISVYLNKLGSIGLLWPPMAAPVDI
jgi:hypothetical protein